MTTATVDINPFNRCPFKCTECTVKNTFGARIQYLHYVKIRRDKWR